MKEQMYINILGHCDKCNHIATRNVRVRLDDSCIKPCECPECHEGTVYFEKLAVHHRTVGAGMSSPSLDSFKKTRRVFLWGLLTVGIYVMLACGIVLRYGEMIPATGRYLLITGLVLILVLLWFLLCKLYDKASMSGWRSPHGFLPDE